MLFPSTKMRQTVQVRSAGEDLGDGATWGEWAPLRCSVDLTDQLVRGQTGADIFTTATILCRPDRKPGHADPALLSPEDQVDIDGDVRTIKSISPARSPGGRVRGYQIVAT